jgi:hypothetical protein
MDTRKPTRAPPVNSVTAGPTDRCCWAAKDTTAVASGRSIPLKYQWPGTADWRRAMDVVGLQEHFDDFVVELKRRFGWRLGDPVHQNQTERVSTGTRCSTPSPCQLGTGPTNRRDELSER